MRIQDFLFHCTFGMLFDIGENLLLSQ